MPEDVDVTGEATAADVSTVAAPVRPALASEGAAIAMVILAQKLSSPKLFVAKIVSSLLRNVGDTSDKPL